MLLGFALLAAGIALAFFWTQEFFFALKGALILGFMLLGLTNILIGLSKQKSKRGFARALQDDVGENEALKETTASAPQT